MSSNSTPIPSEAYFITPPQLVSWSKESTNSEVAAWGTNEPYLNYSTTKLRKLTLGDAMFEGFSDGKQVEGNIKSLEAAMKMVLNEEGFASPYCWNVFAGNKSYGTFVISSVQVKEQMRDMSGNATRAVVDVELTEVPSYQVSTGIDLTSPATGGRLTSEQEFAGAQLTQATNTQVANQDTAIATARTNTAPSSDLPAVGPETAYRQPGVGAFDTSTGRLLTTSPTEVGGNYVVNGVLYSGKTQRPIGTI